MGSIQRWLQRYLAAELVGLIVATLCATLVDPLTDNTLLLVGLSVYGGAASYYAVLVGGELRQDRRAYAALNIGYTWRAAFIMVSQVALEFGSAELLDSLLISPTLMYLCLRLMPNLQLAVILAEIASSAVFYMLVMVIHAGRQSFSGYPRPAWRLPLTTLCRQRTPR